MSELTKIVIDIKNTMKNWFYTKSEVDTALNNKADANVASTSSNGLMSSSDKTKLDGITDSADAVSFSRSLNTGTKIGTLIVNGTGTDLYCQTDTKVTVDSSLSSTSTNPVQNKVVNTALGGKANSSHTHNISDVTDLTSKLGSVVASGTIDAATTNSGGSVIYNGIRIGDNTLVVLYFKAVYCEDLTASSEFVNLSSNVLPEALRPESNIYQFVSSSSAYPCAVYVTSEGKLRITCYNGTNTGSIHTTLVYVV